MPCISYMTFAKRRDANHKAVVSDLEKMGVTCLDLSSSGGGVTDIVTYHRGNTVFLEIKFKDDPRLKKTQAKFLGEWPGHCGIALNIDEAFKMATEPEKYCLTAEDKRILTGIYLQMQEKEIRLKVALLKLGR